MYIEVHVKDRKLSITTRVFFRGWSTEVEPRPLQSLSAAPSLGERMRMDTNIILGNLHSLAMTVADQ